MKTLSMPMNLGPDFEIDLSDEDMDYFTEFLASEFPEVKYDIREKAAGSKNPPQTL